jgi:hypothetical protein
MSEALDYDTKKTAGPTFLNIFLKRLKVKTFALVS